MDLLNDIRAAFPSTPYPGDRVLSECWCEECAWSVRNLRGKSWKQVRLDDLNLGDGGHLSPEAFRYYLPALLAFAVQHPDHFPLAGEINARFVAVCGDSDDEIQRIRKLVASLTKPQRATLVRFFQWLQAQGWQAPVLIDAAIKAVGDNLVEAIPAEALLEFARAKERESLKSKEGPTRQ